MEGPNIFSNNIERQNNKTISSHKTLMYYYSFLVTQNTKGNTQKYIFGIFSIRRQNSEGILCTKK